jgi:large repetitive protein
MANTDDACPGDAEDMDSFKDDDGCPELDNDLDGFLDDGDRCPIEGEDIDGHLDDDGCIDPDNDGDKVLDVDDRCPMEPEDFDGHLDNDGCDEPDNDVDGIPDVIDQCALEAETINGKTDDDGCPDNGDSAVMVMPDRIEIFEPVLFDGTSAKLSKKSTNVLGQVAATLRANRDFKRIRVTVHVHPRNDEDQALSEKRAKAVRDWMVKWGIEPERVEAKGLGSTRPLVDKKKKGAAAINDRVEFIILEKEVEE